MSTERWERTKQILEEALRLAPERRQSYLDLVCGSDSGLQKEIESLIASSEEAGSQFMAAAAPEFLQFTTPIHVTQEPLGTVIGDYRLLEEVGRGGMGQVWLAEQTAPVRRRVALKVIRSGIYDDDLLKRFQLERQSLAMMDHPSIAKIFDAGATPDGRPYFVMEYVPGVPITDYCDAHHLKIDQRLEIFTEVCQAVQHAHHKAVIHRDLKPANILVQELDGKAIPRIIDFGVAKLTSPQISGESLYTQTGRLVGTPGYMSPEQSDRLASDVDTRSDVYSLGVVLYVLLTGCLPFEAQPGKEQPVHEMLRLVCEEDPPRPSTKVSDSPETSSVTAEARGTEPKQLVSMLRGDLDSITLKAIEKDRSRRYVTPSELAADIERYLKHEPVMARPARVTYRARKYFRRHRIAVTFATALLTLIGGFSVMQAVQLRRITRERDRANRITNFMTQMFKVSDPSDSRGNTITAREILDKASKDIDAGLSKDPELQAQMMNVMANVYENIGLYPQEQSLLQRAVEIDRRAFGPQNPAMLTSASSLGWSLFRVGRYAEAETLLRQTLATQRRVLGPEDPDTVHTMSWLGAVLSVRGQNDESEKLLRQTMDIQRRRLGSEHHDTLVAMSNLASELLHAGQYAEAEKLTREALDIQQRVLGADHPDTLNSRNLLGAELWAQGRRSDVERLMRETLVIQQRVLGPEHPRTLDLMMALARIIRQEGRYAEAEELFRQNRAVKQRVLGPEHPLTAETTYSLACLLAVEGRHDEALSVLLDAVQHGLEATLDLYIDKDDDFKSLRGDLRFTTLVADAKRRAAAQRAK